MSNSTHSTQTENGTPATVPRAMIHKKILDAAQSSPNASIQELATAVSGASKDLVERVLDDYGDPAETENAPETTEENAPTTHPTSTVESTSEPMTKSETEHVQIPDPIELTDKQCQTLRAIYDRPEATQVELAETLGVTSATISNRVNEIAGFEWTNRSEFVHHMVTTGKLNSNGNMKANRTTTTNDTEPNSDPTQALAEHVTTLTKHVEALEHRLSEQSNPSRAVFPGPDLATQIIRACLHADHITEDDETEIVRAIIAATDAGD